MPNWTTHEDCTCEKAIGIGVARCCCFDLQDPAPPRSRPVVIAQPKQPATRTSAFERWLSLGKTKKPDVKVRMVRLYKPKEAE